MKKLCKQVLQGSLAGIMAIAVRAVSTLREALKSGGKLSKLALMATKLPPQKEAKRENKSRFKLPPREINV